MTSKNLEISYLYRDAANYKQYASVVVSNPQEFTPEQLKAALLQHFAARSSLARYPPLPAGRPRLADYLFR